MSRTLIVVVAGHEKSIEAHKSTTVGSISEILLSRERNADLGNWEMRDKGGESIPFDRQVGTVVGYPDGILFLNLRSGIGG